MFFLPALSISAYWARGVANSHHGMGSGPLCCRLEFIVAVVISLECKGLAVRVFILTDMQVLFRHRIVS